MLEFQSLIHLMLEFFIHFVKNHHFKPTIDQRGRLPSIIYRIPKYMEIINNLAYKRAMSVSRNLSNTIYFSMCMINLLLAYVWHFHFHPYYSMQIYSPIAHQKDYC